MFSLWEGIFRLHLWATVTTIANTALGVAGLGVAGYAITAKPQFSVFYFGVAFICVACAIVGFVNLWFLNEAARRYEEKNRPIREERERKRAARAAKRAEREAAREAAKAEAEREAAARAEEEAAAQAGLVLFSQEEASPEEEAPPVSAPGEPDYGQAEALPAACQDKNPGNAAGDSQS